MAPTNNLYRPEIDGLRALAVVAVIINPFIQDVLPSGHRRTGKNFGDFLSAFYERRVKQLPMFQCPLISLKRDRAAGVIFTQSQVVFIGLLSSLLYLWHWGILSISRWTIGIHWWSVPFQIAIMFVLAFYAYTRVEAPVHKMMASQKKPDPCPRNFLPGSCHPSTARFEQGIE
ncbi:MAG: hypothetical protein VKL58_00550 [Cyanobacteriota bacterium]|nr:hypothetical protein [Cyanobacteriota bacterium]